MRDRYPAQAACRYVDIDSPAMASYRRLQDEIAAGLVELPVVLIDGQVAMSGRISSAALLSRLAKELLSRGR